MTNLPKISAIVAKSQNSVIGRDGGLPWHLSSDLQFFKNTTMGKPVMMGRVTWEGLPFPLPGRPNLVLTRNQDYLSPNAEIYHSINELVGRGNELAGELGLDEIIVAGGAKLYADILEHCDRLYVTDVHVRLSGDAHFPFIEPTDWKLSSERFHGAGPNDDHDFTIRTYDRK